MEVNDTFNLQPIATATSDTEGNYELRVDPDVNLGPMTSDSGEIDLAVVVPVGADGVQSHMFTEFAQSVEDHAATSESSSAAPDLTVRRIEIGEIELSVDRDTAFRSSGNWDDIPEDPPILQSCTSTYKQNLGARTVTVGAAYITTSKANHQFRYSAGRSTVLGVGTSASGSVGSFKSAGTLTRSKTASVGWALQPGNSKREFRTKFEYRKYKLACVNGASYRSYYSVSPSKWVGGNAYASVSTTPASRNCIRYYGGDLTTTNNRGTTWTNGVDLKTALGIDLSARTELNSGVSSTFTFSGSALACGTDDYATDAARVVIKP